MEKKDLQFGFVIFVKGKGDFGNFSRGLIN